MNVGVTTPFRVSVTFARSSTPATIRTLSGELLNVDSTGIVVLSLARIGFSVSARTVA